MASLVCTVRRGALDTRSRDIVGEMELTITPTFTTGAAGTDLESSLVLDLLNTVIDARRWTATATSTTAPPEIIFGGPAGINANL